MVRQPKARYGQFQLLLVNVKPISGRLLSILR